jgi:hypothetical protein
MAGVLGVSIVNWLAELTTRDQCIWVHEDRLTGRLLVPVIEL